MGRMKGVKRKREQKEKIGEKYNNTDKRMGL